MYLFLITFLALYGGMHLYAFVKLRGAFEPRPLLKRALIIWMGIMTIVPLLVRFAERYGMEETALIFAWPGYIWMGFLFIFSSALFCTDTIRQVCRYILRRLSRQLPEFISTRNACRFSLIAALLASLYATVESDQIRSEHVVITTTKLQPSVSKIRIVQISDVHIGLLLQERRIRRILQKIREADPDILVSTGDLIDGKLNYEYGLLDRNPLAASLASLPAPSGKFAIIGNHEVYAGLSQAVAISRAAGFTMLRNQAIALKNGITLTGIDDRAVNPGASVDPTCETALINSVSRDSFHILMKHRPDILPESDGRFDLQLSGHVHGGQIFPFNFFVRLKHPIPCGMTKTKAGSNIYVSRGTGTWGPPMRLLAPPEVTVIDIVRQ